MFVSVSPNDFTVEKLACLGRTLRSRHPEWKDVTVAIFSSSDALKHYPPGGGVGDDLRPRDSRRIMESKLRLNAAYLLDVAKQREYLELSPLGDEGTVRDSIIDLPLTGRPSCRLEVGGRCAMVLGALEYPVRALDARGQGTITVAGTLKRDGAVRDVRVVDAKVSPVEADRLLKKEVLKNVSGWRVDAGARDEPFRVTFRFAIDDSLPGGPKVEWALPDHVLVTARAR
jgi:TonB family protein